MLRAASFLTVSTPARSKRSEQMPTPPRIRGRSARLYDLYGNMAGAENQTLGPGLEFGLEPGGPIELGAQAIVVSLKNELSFCRGCDMIAYFTKELESW